MPLGSSRGGSTVTKEVAARVEASWKRASEATGAFQTKNKGGKGTTVKER